MQQLSLGLGIVPQNSQTSTYDPYWDEITCEDVGEQDEKSNCPPTQYEFQVGDRVYQDSPFIPNYHPLGTVVSVGGQQAYVSWEPYGASTPINIEYLKLAHQQLSPYKSVGGQVNNNTKHQSGWIEKYPVIRADNKYYYWRFAWREGGRERGKKQRKYIGSCTNPKAMEKVEMVRNAIALGKLPLKNGDKVGKWKREKNRTIHSTVTKNINS